MRRRLRQPSPPRMVLSLAGVAAASGLAAAPGLAAQEAGEPRVVEVGEMAPDFELVGATRFGILETPVRLSDFRGQTVVLAFFFKVRTKG